MTVCDWPSARVNAVGLTPVPAAVKENVPPSPAGAVCLVTTIRPCPSTSICAVMPNSHFDGEPGSTHASGGALQVEAFWCQLMTLGIVRCPVASATQV